MNCEATKVTGDIKADWQTSKEYPGKASWKKLSRKKEHLENGSTPCMHHTAPS